jgi:hypothetical protein
MRYQNKRSWKYRIYEDVEYDLYHDFGKIAHPYFHINGNHLTVKEGYHWDGPSGPTIDTDNFMSPSLIHDVLFQCMREDLLSRDRFKHANIELKMQCRERGMSRFRAWYVYHAVDKFGKQNIKSDIHEVK